MHPSTSTDDDDDDDDDDDNNDNDVLEVLLKGKDPGFDIDHSCRDWGIWFCPQKSVAAVHTENKVTELTKQGPGAQPTGSMTLGVLPWMSKPWFRLQGFRKQ